jgi:ribosome-associated translation inhibitor RaiA
MVKYLNLLDGVLKYFLLRKISQMEIIINSVNFKPGTKLERFVREKVSKLFNKSDQIIRAKVVLRQVESRNPENKLCEIRLMIPGNDHFVRKCTDVYEKSVLLSVEVLQKIIRRRKNKVIAQRYAQ